MLKNPIKPLNKISRKNSFPAFCMYRQGLSRVSQLNTIVVIVLGAKEVVLADKVVNFVDLVEVVVGAIVVIDTVVVDVVVAVVEVVSAVLVVDERLVLDEVEVAFVDVEIACEDDGSDSVVVTDAVKVTGEVDVEVTFVISGYDAKTLFS